MGCRTCCGRCVELRDLVSLHEVPVSVWVRVCGDAFEHDCSGSVDQGAVHDVSVASDPSAVRDASVHVSVLIEEWEKRELQLKRGSREEELMIVT